MNHFKSIWLLVVILQTIFVMSAGDSFAGSKITFSSLDANQPYKVSGTLYLPNKTSNPSPAIVLVHGTAGIDVRGEFYREPILKAGIAIFEVDFKTGIYTSALDRPKNETFLPLAFAALKELRKLQVIDPNRIGIMGFSMGGGITLRTAIEANRKMWMGNETGFATHAAFYPVCRYIIPVLEKSGSGLTGAPIIVFYGTEDSYGEGEAVPELKRLLAQKFNFDLKTVEYKGATHGFNRKGSPVNYRDPASKDGRGYMAWDEVAANDSLTRVVAFLRQTLTAK